MFAGSGMDLLQWQPDREARAAAGPARPSDLAAVLFRDLPRDRQPESGALGLGREERLEETLAHLVGVPVSAVGDRQLLLFAVPVAGQRQLAAARQRLQAVLHQIETGLTEQTTIDLQQRH